MKKRTLLPAIGSLRMRLHETRLVGPDPRTGRLRLDTSRSRVPRPTESLRLKTDTKIPVDDYMGKPPPGAASVLGQRDAKDRLKKLAPSFRARADAGGSEGRLAIYRVAVKTSRSDYVGALAVARDFMGIGKGGCVALDTPICKAGNARRVTVPHSTAKVEVQPPKKTRKTHPFQGFVDFQGIKIDIENKAGSRRRGVSEDGTLWDVKMHHHYGEIRGTKGTDGDLLDAYVGPNADAPLVVVVHQQDPKTKAFDEDKVMLGFDTAEEAVKAYRAQYDSPGFYGGHTAMNIGAFWRWVHDKRNRGTRVAAKGFAHCVSLSTIIIKK